MRGVAVGGLSAAGCARPPAVRQPESAAPQDVLPCAHEDPRGAARCVSPARIDAELSVVAAMRPPGSVHHARVRRRCVEVFEASGFVATRHEFPGGLNVIGTRPGLEPGLAPIMVGAHYDHIPGCQGADDNASGVVAVLEVARVLGPLPTARTLTVACWDREEDGLLGSRAWVRGPMQRAVKPAVYFNFDAIAYTDDRPNAQRVPTGFGVLFPGPTAALEARERRADFIAVVANAAAVPWARPIEAHAATLALPVALLAIPQLVVDSHAVIDLQRSDHAPFWDYGVPAIMVTDSAEFRSPAYHCREAPDDLASLDRRFLQSVIAAAVHGIAAATQTNGGGPGDDPVDDPGPAR